MRWMAVGPGDTVGRTMFSRTYECNTIIATGEPRVTRRAAAPEHPRQHVIGFDPMKE